MPSALKSVLQWVVYVGLVVLAVGTMLLGKVDTVLVERLRLQVNDVIVPILGVLSQPADALAEGFDRLGQWIDVASENERLRDERERLLRWQAAAQRLEAENAALRRLLQVVPDPQASWRSARVVADPSGAFAQSLLISAGSLAGVDKGQTVLSGEGLVGRVVGASERASRVLLITDLDSRVPVLVGAGRERAVLAGDNTERPRLVHVAPGAAIAPGDAVVTSGIGGGFPAGLPVGVVATLDDNLITVATAIDRSRLEFVRVVDFGLESLRVDPPLAAGTGTGTGPPRTPAGPSVGADAR